jgi:hypothetical protein
MPVKLFSDALQPEIEEDRFAVFLASIQRREAANDARLALRNNEIGVRNNEEWRSGGGDPQRL